MIPPTLDPFEGYLYSLEFTWGVYVGGAFWGDIRQKVLGCLRAPCEQTSTLTRPALLYNNAGINHRLIEIIPGSHVLHGAGLPNVQASIQHEPHFTLLVYICAILDH